MNSRICSAFEMIWIGKVDFRKLLMGFSRFSRGRTSYPTSGYASMDRRQQSLPPLYRSSYYDYPTYSSSRVSRALSITYFLRPDPTRAYRDIPIFRHRRPLSNLYLRPIPKHNHSGNGQLSLPHRRPPLVSAIDDDSVRTNRQTFARSFVGKALMKISNSLLDNRITPWLAATCRKRGRHPKHRGRLHNPIGHQAFRTERHKGRRKRVRLNNFEFR